MGWEVKNQEYFRTFHYVLYFLKRVCHWCSCWYVFHSSQIGRPQQLRNYSTGKSTPGIKGKLDREVAGRAVNLGSEEPAYIPNAGPPQAVWHQTNQFLSPDLCALICITKVFYRLFTVGNSVILSRVIWIQIAHLPLTVILCENVPLPCPWKPAVWINHTQLHCSVLKPNSCDL